MFEISLEQNTCKFREQTKKKVASTFGETLSVRRLQLRFHQLTLKSTLLFFYIQLGLNISFDALSV